MRNTTVLAALVLVSACGAVAPTSPDDRSPTTPEPALTPGTARVSFHAADGTIRLSQILGRQNAGSAALMMPEDTIAGLQVIHYLSAPREGQPDSEYVLALNIDGDTVLTAILDRHAAGDAKLYRQSTGDSSYSETTRLNDSVVVRLKEGFSTIATVTIFPDTSSDPALRLPVNCGVLSMKATGAAAGMIRSARSFDWGSAITFAEVLYDAIADLVYFDCYQEFKDGFANMVKALTPRDQFDMYRAFRM